MAPQNEISRDELEAGAGVEAVGEVVMDEEPLGDEAPSDVVEDVPSITRAEFASFSAPEGNGRPRSSNNLDLLMDVTLKVTVELGRVEMSVKDVLDLGGGSIIELEKLAGEPVEVLVNGMLVALGEVVVVDEKFGVRVTKVLSPHGQNH